MKSLFTAILAMQDDPVASTYWRHVDGPAVTVRCPTCRGRGETHSSERDLCCPSCDGRGTLPADYRERMQAEYEAHEADEARDHAAMQAAEREYLRGRR